LWQMSHTKQAWASDGSTFTKVNHSQNCTERLVVVLVLCRVSLIIHAICDAFCVLGFHQVSPAEYVEDFEKPLKEAVKFPVWAIIFNFIPLIGNIIWIIIVACLYPKNSKKKGQAVFDAINAKYEQSRGIHLEWGKAVTQTQDGNEVLTDGIMITVKHPGVPLPGIELFTPCRDAETALLPSRHIRMASRILMLLDMELFPIQIHMVQISLAQAALHMVAMRRREQVVIITSILSVNFLFKNTPSGITASRRRLNCFKDIRENHIQLKKRMIIVLSCFFVYRSQAHRV